MARGHFRLLERCVLLRLAVPMEGGGSATAAGSGHGEEGARMRWAVRREAQRSKVIEALGKDFFCVFRFGDWDSIAGRPSRARRIAAVLIPRVEAYDGAR